MDGVSRVNSGNYNHPTGLGYIVIPIGVDRDLYIQTCYRKERVAIQLDGGGSVINNCYISRSTLQDIIFPDEVNQLGSCVAFICLKHHNLPIIVSRISKPDETQLIEENSFKKLVSTKGANVAIEGKGKTGELFINVESNSEDEGSIYVTLKSKGNTSKFELKCFGEINIYSEGKTSLKALKDVNFQKIRIEGKEEITSAEIILSDEGFEMRDSYNNVIRSTEEGIINIFPSSRCNLFEGTEPIPKGDTLKTELEKMKDRISTIIDTLSGATAASGSSSTYATFVKVGLETITETEDFTDMNSDKSFTD